MKSTLRLDFFNLPTVVSFRLIAVTRQTGWLGGAVVSVLDS